MIRSIFERFCPRGATLARRTRVGKGARNIKRIDRLSPAFAHPTGRTSRLIRRLAAGLRVAGRSRKDCGRRRRCRSGSPGTSICPPPASRRGNTPVLGCRAAPRSHPRDPKPCAVRCAADCFPAAFSRPGLPGPRHGWRSWRRRSDRARPWIPIPSARPSMSRRRESSWSARESRNRSAALQCPRRKLPRPP